MEPRRLEGEVQDLEVMWSISHEINGKHTYSLEFLLWLQTG